MHIRFDDQSGSFAMAEPVRVIAAWSLDEVEAALDQIEAAAYAGYWCAGYVAYEAGPAFDSALVAHEPIAELPLVWFGVFESRQPVDPPPHGQYELVHWYPNISERTHSESIDRIRSYIESGDSYQVNHTFRLRSEFSGDPMGLYADLVRAQRGDYAVFLDTGTHFIASASPELFFRFADGRIEVKPMKGTARRGRWSEEDRQLADNLITSEKDRAENLMIVDLLRNDVGKMAVVGSVSTDRLFELEKYETVWQLTSTITADLPDDVSLKQIFGALFPCGSITGAPKARTTEIIEELEIDPRGVYCGAIGLVGPATDDRGIEAQFNVAIRTVTIESQTGIAEFGVGGGITWDSTSEGEYQEALWKTAVLEQHRPEFDLTEALRWDDGYLFESEHRRRMQESAEYFGFEFDDERVSRALRGVELDSPTKVRLRLGADGLVTAEAAGVLEGSFADDWDAASAITVSVAPTPVQPHDPMLYHKTTHRPAYERATVESAADEPILLNAFGELTEGANTNLALRVGGQWFTPPLQAGCLPGIYRGILVERGVLTERVLKPIDLETCEAIGMINSVRGWRQGQLIRTSP